MAKNLENFPNRSDSRIELLVYEAPVVRFSISDWLVFPFSPACRLKRQLQVLLRSKCDRTACDQLSARANKIGLNKNKVASNKNVCRLLAMVQSHLCILYSGLGELNLAAAAADAAAAVEPDMIALLKIRLALINHMIQWKAAPGDLKRQLEFVAKDTRHHCAFKSDVICSAFDYLFSRSQFEAIVSLAASGCQQFRQLDYVTVMVQLCKCPDSFNSREEASQWAKATNPATVSFSLSMKLNALLVGAQSCEYNTDFERMKNLAAEARRIDNSNHEAVYWHVRAQLHGQEPANSSLPHVVPQSDKWKRITLAATLHSHPGSEAAVPMLDILEGKLGAISEAERLLLLDLLRRAMTPSVSIDRVTSARRRTLCEQARAIVQRPIGWMTINVAIDLLVYEHDYKRAWTELRRKECSGEELGLPLREIASVLVAEHIEVTCSIRSVEAVRMGLSFFVGEVKESPEVETAQVQKVLELFSDDEWTRNVPGLMKSVEGLMCILRVVSGGTELDRLNGFVVDSVSPAWLKWLAFRTLLLYSKPSRKAVIPPDSCDAALLVSFASWVQLYASTPAAREGEAWLQMNSQAVTMQRIWALHSRQDLPHPPGVGINTLSHDEEISAWAENLAEPNPVRAVLRLEMKLTQDYAEVRSGIASKDCRIAAARVIELLDRAKRSPRTVQHWWEPCLTYWRAVALAQLGSCEEAVAALRSLLGGPKDLESRAQLALLAIQRNHLDEAEEWLAGASILFPSLLYALALQAAREGELERAVERLSAFDEQFGDSLSYRAAGSRLLAALEERRNNLALANEILRGVLQRNPGDSIAAERMLRVISRIAYAQPVNHECNEIDIIAAVARNSNRAEQYHLLLDLLGRRAETIQLAPRALASGFAWQQLLIRRTMEQGDYERASEFAMHSPTGVDNNCPSYLGRSRFILQSWMSIRHAWRRYDCGTQPGSLAARLFFGEIIQAAQGYATETDIPVYEIFHAARFGLNLLSTDSSAGDVADTAATKSFSESSGNAFIQRMSADFYGDAGTVSENLDSGPKEPRGAHNLLLTAEQHLIAGALLAWRSGDDESYLASAAELGIEREYLPVSNENLWTASAFLLLRRGAYQSIIDGRMPAGVENLANADAGILLSLAYIRLAAQRWRAGDVRAALQRTRQALGTLTTLRETSSAAAKSSSS